MDAREVPRRLHPLRVCPVTARQLALELPHRPAQGRGDFLVAPSNEAAVAWIDRWPEWPAPGLALYGPAGSGKSHLAAVWQARSGAVSLAPGALATGVRADAVCSVLESGEDALSAGGAGAEEALFHLYNRLAAARAHILITARTPPARWPVRLRDLASRLAVLPSVEIRAPDDTMLGGLFAKLFRDRQLTVSGETVLYLVQRIERSGAAVAATVEALDRASLAARRPITVPLARAVLGLG